MRYLRTVPRMEKRDVPRARLGTPGYLVGAALARTGDEMSGPALLLAGLAATRSAGAASALLAALTVAAAVGGPVLGVLLDRAARPGRLLAGALALYAGALAAALLSLGRLPLLVTALIAVPAGLLGPALSGGWTAQLPGVVAAAGLSRATALDAMTFDVASLAGPVLPGTVAGVCGAPLAGAVAVALICLAVPAAWGLPAARRAAAGTGSTGLADLTRLASSTGSTGSLVGELAAGVRAITHSRVLARATLGSVVSCAGQGVLVACVPLLGERVLGGAGDGAVLLSGIAVAALAANALLARVPGARWAPAPETVLRLAPVLQAGALLLAATGSAVALVAAVVLVGAAEGPQLTALFAIRHREAPEALRGRLFTTGASLKLTGFALGAGLAGPLAARSPTAALLAGAGLHLLAARCGAVGGPNGGSGPWGASGRQATRAASGRDSVRAVRARTRIVTRRATASPSAISTNAQTQACWPVMCWSMLNRVTWSPKPVCSLHSTKAIRAPMPPTHRIAAHRPALAKTPSWVRQTRVASPASVPSSTPVPPRTSSRVRSPPAVGNGRR